MINEGYDAKSFSQKYWDRYKKLAKEAKRNLLDFLRDYFTLTPAQVTFIKGLTSFEAVSTILVSLTAISLKKTFGFINVVEMTRIN